MRCTTVIGTDESRDSTIRASASQQADCQSDLVSRLGRTNFNLYVKPWNRAHASEDLADLNHPLNAISRFLCRFFFAAMILRAILRYFSCFLPRFPAFHFLRESISSNHFHSSAKGDATVHTHVVYAPGHVVTYSKHLIKTRLYAGVTRIDWANGQRRQRGGTNDAF